VSLHLTKQMKSMEATSLDCKLSYVIVIISMLRLTTMDQILVITFEIEL